MGAAAGAWGPGFGPAGWAGGCDSGFEAQVVDVLRKIRAQMGSRSGPGPWWGPPPGGPWGGWIGGPSGQGRRGWPFGPDSGPSRSRAGRGDVRSAILLLLDDAPRHGYQIIQDITERSGGAWRPSPGSVYPALSALQDEGLVDDEKVEGRRVFSLTDAGRAYVRDRAEALAQVFEANSAEPEHEDVTDLRQLLFGVGAAAVQVIAAGTPDQAAAARRVLQRARTDLYRLLANDEPDQDQP